MEFFSLISEHLGTVPAPWVAAVAAPMTLLVACDARRIRVRIRRPRPHPAAHRHVAPLAARAASLLGLAVAMTSHPAAAGTRKPVSPHRRVTSAAPPWSEAGGFPPPRPLARTGAGVLGKTPPHPALHGGETANRKGRVHPLFRREVTHPTGDTERGSATGSRKDDLADAMARHPSGKGPERSPSTQARLDKAQRHVVRAGESLWSIAEQVLGTDDPRAVARYWPRIHRLNLGTIGRDPSVIRPGQVLELPVVPRERN